MLTIFVSYNITVKRKEDNNRRRPFAGLMLVVLYFSKKTKALIIIGAVMTAFGFIGGSYFGSIVVTEVSQGKINQVTFYSISCQWHRSFFV
jgi:hypothetical protein